MKWFESKFSKTDVCAIIVIKSYKGLDGTETRNLPGVPEVHQPPKISFSGVEL
jgi:hypothetical protein